jgi:hypothetical protein
VPPEPRGVERRGRVGKGTHAGDGHTGRLQQTGHARTSRAGRFEVRDPFFGGRQAVDRSDERPGTVQRLGQMITDAGIADFDGRRPGVDVSDLHRETWRPN